MPHTAFRQMIHLHVQAPAKPATGQPCNGCGVCCAAQPCPLGMLLSRQRRGACHALVWDVPRQRYLCGPLSDPSHWLPWLPGPLAAMLVRRWIAAAQGCDSDLEAA